MGFQGIRIPEGVQSRTVDDPFRSGDGLLERTLVLPGIQAMSTPERVVCSTIVNHPQVGPHDRVYGA